MDPAFFQLVQRIRLLESQSEDDSLRSEQIMGELENASEIYGLHLDSFHKRLAVLQKNLTELKQEMQEVVSVLKMTVSTASLAQVHNRVDHLNFSDLLLRRELKGLVQDLEQHEADLDRDRNRKMNRESDSDPSKEMRP